MGERHRHGGASSAWGSVIGMRVLWLESALGIEFKWDFGPIQMRILIIEVLHSAQHIGKSNPLFSPSSTFVPSIGTFFSCHSAALLP